jgi:hypothetical protein
MGIRRITLTASAAGRSVYEKEGFVGAPDMMRIMLTAL